MKKLLTGLLAGLLICGILAFAAAEEKPEVQVLSGKTADRIRNAKDVYWAGGNYILADNELVRTEDDSIVLSGVWEWEISPWWENCILVEVPNEGVYEVDPDGRTEIVPGVDSVRWIGVSDGIAILETADKQFSVLSRKYDTVFRTGIDTSEYDIIRNPENGDAYFMLYNDPEEKTVVYRENGDLAWEGPYRLVPNAYFSYVTNGHLTGYDEDGKAVVIDAFTGEVTASFSPEWGWRPFMGEYEIYEDNTALLLDYSTEETAVASLDGEVLITGAYIYDRSDPTPGYYLDVNDDTYFWSGITFQFTRLIDDSNHEEPVRPEDLPDSIYVNPVLLDPETKTRFSFKEGPDDETLTKWEGAAIWPSSCQPGIGYSVYELVSTQGWAAVADKDGMIRVVDINWEPIVPWSYDNFYSTGGGYIGRNGGETDFFDEDLNLVMSTCTDRQ